MVGVRKHCSTVRVTGALLVVLSFAATAAHAGMPARVGRYDGPALAETDLYDHPVLAIEANAHSAPIKSQAVDEAGGFVVTGGDDRTVRIWSAVDGKLDKTIRIPIGPESVGRIYTVAISPDGSTIAAGGYTGHHKSIPIYIFDRASGKVINRIVDDLQEVARGMTFSPDGRFLAVVLAAGHGLRIFETKEDWREVFRDAAYSDDCFGVGFSRDGRLATVAYDGFLRSYAYDPKSASGNFHMVGKPERTANGRQPHELAYRPDGKVLAIGYLDSQYVDVLDATTLSLLTVHSPRSVHIEPIGFGRIAWSADNQTLFAAGGVVDEQRRNLLLSWDRGGFGAERSAAYCGPDTASGLNPLAGGNVVIASVLPCLGSIDSGGGKIWSVDTPVLNLTNQTDTLRLSADGKIVEFGDYRYTSRFRFDTRLLALSNAPPDDPSTFAPNRSGLAVDGWRNGRAPHIGDVSIPLQSGEFSRSFAVEPHAQGFYLGSSWSIRAFDSSGSGRWSKEAAYGEVWAVNASLDGRLVVVVYSDGTIRWHRAADGAELLALQVLPNKKDVSQWDWVLWTPEGFYEATPGAQDVLRWVVNHGPDQAATTLPVSAIAKLHRPKALPLVLDNLETARALGIEDISAARLDVQAQTQSDKPPGAVLHVLTIGVDKFGDKAGGLSLDYAADDARDVANALRDSQKLSAGKSSLYADVKVESLIDDEADNNAISDALDRMAASMAKSDSNQDVAVILMSSHGEMINGKFYLIPYGFDLGSENASRHSALSASEFAEKIAAIAAHGRVLLLLDACHSGAVGAGKWVTTPDAKALQDAMDLENVTVLTSSKKNEQSQELSVWRHGALSQAFLDALRAAGDSDGVVKLSAIVEAMTNEVKSLTKDKQHLGMHMNYDADLFVANRL